MNASTTGKHQLFPKTVALDFVWENYYYYFFDWCQLCQQWLRNTFSWKVSEASTTIYLLMLHMYSFTMEYLQKHQLDKLNKEIHTLLMIYTWVNLLLTGCPPPNYCWSTLTGHLLVTLVQSNTIQYSISNFFYFKHINVELKTLETHLSLYILYHTPLSTITV